jgi:hypothetical protein
MGQVADMPALTAMAAVRPEVGLAIGRIVVAVIQPFLAGHAAAALIARLLLPAGLVALATMLGVAVQIHLAAVPQVLVAVGVALLAL